MARKPCIHYPGALYHVMLRGNGGTEIFTEDQNHQYVEALVADGVARFAHRIHAYCWMSNHVHLAIQAAVTPLFKSIQNLASRYTRWFNQQLSQRCAVSRRGKPQRRCDVLPSMR